MLLKKKVIATLLCSSLMMAVSGSALASKSCCPFSDETLKENAVPLQDSLQKVLKLKGYTYTWKKDGQTDIGLMAQEVEKEFPQLVHEKDGYKQVDYQKMVAILIEAVRQQQVQIDTLKTKVNALDKK